MSDTSVETLVKRSVGWSVAISILMMVAGLLAVALPQLGGIAVSLLIAWLLIFIGATHFLFGWQARNAGGMVWHILLGILDIAVGAYVLIRPVAGLATFTLMLAIYLVVRGIVEFILSFQLRPMRGSSWLLFDGFISVILGIMIWRTWPSSTEWAIGTLVGISMFFAGFSRLMISLAAKRVTERLT
jgi:uncharacterized membrane protein HdeD (DUF308 family)